MTYNQLIRILEENGWEQKRTKKYHTFKKGDMSITVGNHPSQEVPKGTLHKILKEAGLK